MKFNLASQIRGALRRIFRMSPWHKAAIDKVKIKRPRYNIDGSRHKVDAAWYKCEVCNEEFKITQLEVDHVIPVGPTPGSKNADPNLTWDEFIQRVFCSYENLRVLCKPCHRSKTSVERKQLGRLSKEIRPTRKRAPPDSN